MLLQIAKHQYPSTHYATTQLTWVRAQWMLFRCGLCQVLLCLCLHLLVLKLSMLLLFHGSCCTSINSIWSNSQEYSLLYGLSALSWGVLWGLKSIRLLVTAFLLFVSFWQLFCSSSWRSFMSILIILKLLLWCQSVGCW